MPTVVVDKLEREVTDAEFKRLRSQAMDSETTALYTLTGVADEGTMLVWDNVDGSRTRISSTPFSEGPFRGQVPGLVQEVAKCSACTFATPLNRDEWHSYVLRHIEQAVKGAKAHEGAEGIDMMPQPGQKPGKACSACDATFTSHPANVYEHINSMVQVGPAHENAEALVMKRYSLEAPVVQFPAPNGHQLEPVAQEPRSQRRRPRKRYRKHKGSVTA